MVKEIGERLGLDSGTMTPVLKRLEKGGFVQRQRDSKDERQVRVTLTEKARDVQQEAAKARETVVCALGGSEEKIQTLKKLVDELKVQLRQAA